MGYDMNLFHFWGCILPIEIMQQFTVQLTQQTRPDVDLSDPDMLEDVIAFGWIGPEDIGEYFGIEVFHSASDTKGITIFACATKPVKIFDYRKFQQTGEDVLKNFEFPAPTYRQVEDLTSKLNQMGIQAEIVPCVGYFAG